MLNIDAKTRKQKIHTETMQWRSEKQYKSQIKKQTKLGRKSVSETPVLAEFLGKHKHYFFEIK